MFLRIYRRAVVLRQPPKTLLSTAAMAHFIIDLDKKYNIINFVGECPDIFDSMNNHEMVEEIDQYVATY